MALSTEERLAWLRRVQLFRGCSEASMARLAETTGEIDFPAGAYIVRQGLVGNGLYVIVSGSARVVAGGEVLARMGPGDFFGELAVIDQMPRQASVIADEPVACLGLASWDLIGLLEADPRLAMNLLTELAGRLRAADEQHRH